MDRSQSLEGEATESPDNHPNEILVNAGADQRVPLGTPAILEGSISRQGVTEPLFYQWLDLTTATYLNERTPFVETTRIEALLGFGLHDLVLDVSNEIEASVGSDQVRVLVHDP
jgi:hypothetical protein